MKKSSKNKKLNHEIILASGSKIRQRLLRQAGIRFEICRPDVDEQALIGAQRDATAPDTSLMLARAKALSVPADKRAWVIGCDQVLEFEGRMYGKAADMKEALRRLRLFAGNTHHLAGGCALAQAGKIVWEHKSRASLQMRALEDASIEAYLHRAGPGILASVGCYEIEALGINLMASMAGDYFSILGLPLLPLLGALRDGGALA